MCEMMRLETIIVDDDKAVRFFHKITVTESTLSDDPLSFSNGKEALDYLDLNFEEHIFYLILLDINMPVMNGWEFLKTISQKPYSANIFFAMVTSSVDKADKEKAKLFSHIIDFVEKPITTEECKRIMDNPRIVNLLKL